MAAINYLNCVFVILSTVLPLISSQTCRVGQHAYLSGKRYTPRCDRFGEYEARQCLPLINQFGQRGNNNCRCVTGNGIEISGTEHTTGDIIDCDYYRRGRIASGGVISNAANNSYYCERTTCVQCSVSGCPLDISVYTNRDSCLSNCPQKPDCYICESQSKACRGLIGLACGNNNRREYLSEVQCQSDCSNTFDQGVISSSRCPQKRASSFCSGGRVDFCLDERSCSSGQICCDLGCGRRCVFPNDRSIFTTTGGRTSNFGQDKRGSCPRSTSGLRSCHNECNEDSDCASRSKCCSNGCAKRCVDPYPCEDSPCRLNQECEIDPQCPFGENCRQYRCKEKSTGICPIVATTGGRQCFSDSDCFNTGERCCQAPGFLKYCQRAVGQTTIIEPRAGRCPANAATVSSNTCKQDNECPFNQKCCDTASFGKRCTSPSDGADSHTKIHLQCPTTRPNVVGVRCLYDSDCGLSDEKCCPISFGLQIDSRCIMSQRAQAYTCPSVPSDTGGADCTARGDIACPITQICCRASYVNTRRVCTDVLTSTSNPADRPIENDVSGLSDLNRSVGPSDCKDKNERFSKYNGNCELTCDHAVKKTTIQCPALPQSGCICELGFVRGRDGSCISQKKCPNFKPEQSSKSYENKATIGQRFIQPTVNYEANPTNPPTVFAATPVFGRRITLEPIPAIDRRQQFRETDAPIPVIATNKPQSCSSNEIYTTFEANCDRKCSELSLLSNNPSACSNQWAAGCICLSGHVRSAEGVCISEVECRSKTLALADSECDSGTQVFKQCGPRCEQTCANMRAGILPGGSNCGAGCQRGCFCRAGHVRDVASNQCVLPNLCPPAPATTTLTTSDATGSQCNDIRKEFSSCNAHPDCQKTCQNINRAVACPAICLSGCVCKKGFVLAYHGSNRCITEDKCSESNDPASGIRPVVQKAVAVFEGPKIYGTVEFSQESGDSPLRIVASLSGIDPLQRRGLHIWRYGDRSGRCRELGTHFNPFGVTHGDRNDVTRHLGDLGNIQVNAQGQVSMNLVDEKLSLNGRNSIIGRAIAVSEREDNLNRPITSEGRLDGNAGLPIGCAIVGIKNEI